ncbi:MAG TPA: hypothetical protein VG456_18825 [Candidatus Sulfopaludibacter sp.]|jgi:hypothetical protein|nr:hypothetical protein [Candidatus Sulfopaludibacter sp.]
MAEFSNTVFVARTSDGLAHVNRLTVPEYGVVEIRIKKGAAGSLSHRMPGASTPRNPTGAGADNFNFAPGPQLNPAPAVWTVDPARHDRVKFWYDLYNPFLNITKAKLEIFRRFDTSPIWTRELEGDELLEGEHELEFEYDNAGVTAKRAEWDGAIDTASRFPDGLLTVEHSPYKVRLRVEGPGQSKAHVAWTYVHVLIHHLELEWGVENAIPSTEVEARQPFHDLLNPRAGAVAATPVSASIPIYLNSALFISRGSYHKPVFRYFPSMNNTVFERLPLIHNSAAEMFDNTLYKKYKELWGNGPKIPIFCKVWIQDSGGAAVMAPKAIGKTKFLWDWEDRSAPTVAPNANPFVDDAQNYDVAVTRPPGQNCHKDRGGKRSARRPVFPAQDGYDPCTPIRASDFPFEVKQCPSPRKWASYSYAWREEALAGKTGVMFRPSRMAGDKYRVTVYAAYETADGKKPRLELDTIAAVPMAPAAAPPLPIAAPLQAISGDFEMWRRVPLIRYLKKTAGVTDLVFANISIYYQAAYLDLVDDSGGVITYNPGDWDARLTAEIANWEAVDQYLVDPAVGQHAAGDEGIIFLTPANLHAHMVGMGYTAAEVTNWLNNQGFNNIQTYSKYCEGITRSALVELFNAEFRDNTPGVNISQVSVTHNLIVLAVALPGYSITDGEAADYPKSDEKHSAFLSLLDATQRAGMGFASTSEITAAHEFGHLFFLPHPAPVNGESGYQAHDTTAGVDNCVMSYNPNPRVFCGLCRLRLRGWDKSKLETTQINHKP